MTIRPGAGMDLVISGGSDVEIAEPPGLVNTILDMIPTNPFESLATGNMLQIIVFSLIVGAICARLPEKLAGLSCLLVEGNTLMMTMTSWVMKLAPIGVFALIARTFSDMGLETFLPMISYMGTVFGALILAILLIYVPLLLLVSRVNPLQFFRKFMPAAAFAFSSASSGATIPLTLNSMDHMGVPRRISSFTIPLGATINMHGTAIMQGVASVFIALAYGITLSPADYVTIIVTATLASFSTGAVPGVGLVTLAMVLRSVNLPLEGIAVIMGIDRILDMARTVLNVGGDAVVTTIVARQDGSLDDKVYNSRKPAAQAVES